jgi:hypothetical protein
MIRRLEQGGSTTAKLLGDMETKRNGNTSNPWQITRSTAWRELKT